MFDQYKAIPLQHKSVLQSALRGHAVSSTISFQTMARMYHLALNGLNGPINETGFHGSTLVAEGVTVSSVTDGKTGVYIQLAKLSNQANLCLTVGQKWVMENYSQAMGNVSALVW